MPRTSSDVHEQMARDYLYAVLRENAPATITPVAAFDESPLAGEGKVTVFSFEASLGGDPPEPYYVVAGQTVTNYYPQWGLDAEQIYSVHLGTRFMLVVEVRQVPLSELPPTLTTDLAEALAGVLPGEPVTDIEPVCAFAAETQKHAVCRAKIADEDVYVMGADLPLGIYRETQLPPHVVYQWHLGNVIRMERPLDEDETDEPQADDPAADTDSPA
ncbi:MAG TPA: hypothetical protein PL151_21735 [Phycisphaerae bacterium]|nr:hypothetical protein [Phycisphaerae bacterium]HOJ76166.1 hypothetical protein [Phycisphaerae bacterium]HOQ84542.1 hypothetical protein [Phycisphaerae bacterium]HPP28718.1 hypothetical protein [Phycisphaerae bacterium]HPU25927.1 hypothetical protein [Phycisphaerae bacterium]